MNAHLFSLPPLVRPVYNWAKVPFLETSPWSGQATSILLQERTAMASGLLRFLLEGLARRVYLPLSVNSTYLNSLFYFVF